MKPDSYSSANHSFAELGKTTPMNNWHSMKEWKYLPSVDVRTCKADSFPAAIGDHSDVDVVLFFGLRRGVCVWGGTGTGMRLGAACEAAVIEEGAVAVCLAGNVGRGVTAIAFP